MKVKLGLTDEQVQQLKTDNESIQAKIKAVKDNESLSREEKKSQLMALKEEHKASLKKTLTSEQLSKLEEIKKNRMHKKTK